MSTIKEMQTARNHLAAAVATRVDGRSATINTGQMKIWLEMVDAYLGNAQVALPPISLIEEPPTKRPPQDQVHAAYAAFLEINDGDKVKAQTDLGTWAIGQHAALAVTA